MGRFHASPIFEKKYPRFKDTDFFKGLKSKKIKKALYLKSGKKISLFTGRTFIEPGARDAKSLSNRSSRFDEKFHLDDLEPNPAHGNDWAVNVFST